MKKAYLITTMLLMLLLGQTAQAAVSLTYSGGGDADRYQSATIDTDNDGQINFVMETNIWNIVSANGTVTMTWDNGLTVDISLTNIQQEDPSGWVHAYPELWYGAKAWNTLGPASDGPISLPARLGSMNDFTTTLTYNVTQTDAHYNFPLETWLTRDTSRGETTVGSDEIEIMIWLDFNGMQGAGSTVGSLTTGGRTYNIWRSDAVGNGGWEYFAFQPTSPTRSGTVTINWAPFIQAAQSYSNRANWENLYFTAVEVGTEFGTPDYLQTNLRWTVSPLAFGTTSNPMLGGGTTTTSATTSTTSATTTTTAAGGCDCGTCDWYGTDVPMCCESCSGWGWYDGGCRRSCVCPSSCEGGCVGSQCGGTTSTTTTAATTSTTTTAATTTTTTTAATTSTTTTAATTTTTAAAGCTCDSGCDGTAISPNFSQNGSGQYCWQATSGTYINSWNVAKLEVNDTDYTNKFVFTSSFPAKIDGVWYIYYNSSVPWGHFELNN